MNKKDLLYLSLVSPLILGTSSCKSGGQKTTQTDRKKQPNVVFIYADDLGYGDLECFGAKRIATPNVNKLAENGIRFTNAYSVAATSTPSRYSMFTGEYAFRKRGTGVAAGDASMIIKPERYTMGDMFKEAGYATGAVGKWHLGLGTKRGHQNWNGQLDAGVNDLGFDYSYIMAATGDRVPCVYIENGHIANPDPEHPIEVSYRKNFPGEPTGKENPELLRYLPSHGHDQSIVNGISRIGYMRGGGKALWKDESIADSIVGHAVEFIKANKEKPFFLYCGTNDVHVPRFPAKRFRGKSGLGYRGDAILQFDWSVGEIIKALDETGLLENTIVVLSSDNGPVVDDGYIDGSYKNLGDHTPWGHLRGAKYSAYEAGTRVPVIVSWPAGIKDKGAVSSALMSQVDWMRSLATLVNVEIPAGAAPDSYNQLPVLLGKDKEKGREWVLEQSGTLALRTHQWKYIQPHKGYKTVSWGPRPTIPTGNSLKPQLFNMNYDYEGINVADKYPAASKQMQELLDKVVNKELQK